MQLLYVQLINQPQLLQNGSVQQGTKEDLGKLRLLNSLKEIISCSQELFTANLPILVSVDGIKGMSNLVFFNIWSNDVQVDLELVERDMAIIVRVYSIEQQVVSVTGQSGPFPSRHGR